MDHQPANPAEPIDEERQRAYVALIDKLLLGAREKANAILTAQRELVDEGLVEVMGRYAESLRQYGNQEAAAFLEDCGQQITAFLRQLPDVSRGFSPSGEQEAFLKQLLQTIAECQGDPKVVYPLMRANLARLNGSLVELLREWWEGVLARAEQEQKQALAAVLVNLGACLNQFPLGNPGTNQTIAIAAYHNALRVRTEAEQPQDYAMTKNNLGNAYCRLAPFSANPGELIQKAIAAYSNALRVFTKAQQPQDWARTNTNLGVAYLDLAASSANPGEKIKKAIAAFNDAMLLYTKAEQPQYWAGTNNNLGLAYHGLAPYSANSGEQIGKAITAFNDALQVLSKAEQPQDWAMTNNNLGNAYRDLAPFSANPGEQIEKAIAAYSNSLRVYTKAEQPQDWAMTYNNLGNAYSDLAPFSANPGEQIEKAIAAYDNALRVRTEAERPQDWAGTNNNLGYAYCRLAPFSANPGELIQKAIAAYSNALRVFTKAQLPQDWARTNKNLGAAYLNLAASSANPGEQIQKAIAAYSNVLRVYTKAQQPQDWAGTITNLGVAYLDLAASSANPGEQIGKAITAFNDALQVLTKAEQPTAWATTNNNLGIAYRALAPFSANPGEQIEKAIAAYSNSLRVYIKAEQPQDWAMTTNNLGNAYDDLALFSANPGEQIEKAIAAFNDALRVFTEAELPQAWATTNNNLGNAYCKLALISANPGELIQKAIAAYSNALRVYTKAQQPQDWTRTNTNLGVAYLSLAASSANPGEKIKKAIAAFNDAMLLYTKAEQPQYWAGTNNNLGIAYHVLAPYSANPGEQIRKAIAAFSDALQVYTKAEQPQDWATTNNSLGTAYRALAPFSANPREQIENAIAAYRNALRVRDPVQRPTDCLQTARNLGNLGFSNKLPEVAIDGYLLAITAVENLRSAAINPARKSEIVSEAIEVYANLVQVYVDQQHFDQALEVVDRSKARNLVELLSSKDLYPKGEIPPEVIQRLDELRGSIARAERELNQAQPANGLIRPPLAGSDGIAGPEDARSLAFERIQQERAQKVGERLLQLKQELDRLIQDQIQPIDPSFSLSQKVQPLTIDQLRATLPDGQTVIVSWYVAGPQLLAFILHRDALQPICHRYPEPTLEALIAAMNAYLSAYRSESNSWQAGLPTALDHFSHLLELDALVEKIQHLAPGADQLILIPHRFLHLLPLHALPVAEAAPTPLQDHFSRGVRYAPSLQVLQVVQQRQSTPPHSLFALQNPTQDLLYSDLEVEAIQSLFAAKSTVLKRSEASKGAMEQQKGALTNSACLHFACHGYFNFEQPLLSALLLAGSVLDAAPDDLDADRHLPQPNGSVIDLSECLTLLDLFQLDLRQARLVALSACETGLSDLNSLSDEVVGLSSGFLYAGCNNVIGSLWSVPDISTGLLMAQFYRLLMAQTSEGQPGDVAQALKEAQHWLRTLTFADLTAQRSAIPEAIRDNFEYDLKWLKQKAADSGDNYPFRSPYYWAAFTAVGQ